MINTKRFFENLAPVSIFFLLTFAWASHSYINFFNGLASHLTFCVLAVVSAWALVYPVSVERRSLSAFLIFVSCVIVSDYLSTEFFVAFARDIHWIAISLLAILLSQVIRRTPHVFLTVQTAAFVCITYLLLVMLADAPYQINWCRPPVFEHLRHAGLTIGFFALVLDYGRGVELSKLDRFAFWVTRAARIAGLALVIWTGTRAAILGYLLGILAIAYLQRSRKTLVGYLAEFVIATGLAWAVPVAPCPGINMFSSFGRTFGEATIDGVSSGRISMWATTLTALADEGRLLFGAGGNGFARLQTLWDAPIVPPGHVQPHNIVIQIISDWGIVGLASFTWLTIVALGQKLSRPTTSSAEAVMRGAGAYLLVTAMFDATMFHLEHLVYLAVVLGFLFVQNDRSAGSNVMIRRTYIWGFAFTACFWHLMVSDYRIGLRWYFPT